eukprot:CAMPEP_0172757658 /NCGR_PEP_ID=MMETSP1074-20121228/164240_1 /TAXON_ID=2916 /ORGANISM="Ceratium fusus, Strain PA161109" /LENGTH=53 /DNA_ID=CAMNT_0013591119 /DNA_START=1172 /DNA_END=1329 /DNA_ORIENTATION=-
MPAPPTAAPPVLARQLRQLLVNGDKNDALIHNASTGLKTGGVTDNVALETINL